ncbi:response regulator transcription factor [Cohnella nanjingensis]|uniref:Response regulator n=1 Tax=Cohnella nanjingensis TaxID=1387779 RepID=A0A7X0RUQ4_9BACL|nr:response regulator [Cohnella nanjingensis]MBB6673955.1 response regulator [Cohnella nanjingensis]
MNVNIAVVDDEERIRQGLAKLVEQTGEEYRVVGTYANGQELLDALGGLQLDLVITDIKMPQMNGLQLIERVQQRRPKIKFAILSGFNDFAFARQAIRQGVEDYLLKPVDQSELSELLSRVKHNLELDSYRKAVAAEEHIRLLLSNDVSHLPEHMTQGASRELGQSELFREHYAVILLRTEPELAPERVVSYMASWTRAHKVLAWEPRQTVVVTAIGHGDHADTARELGVTLLQRVPHPIYARLGASAIHQGPLKLREAYLEAEASLQKVWYEDGYKAMNDVHHLAKRGDEGMNLLRLLDKDFRPALQMLDVARAEAALVAWLDDVGRQKPSWQALAEGCAAVSGLIRSERSERGPQPDEPEEEPVVWSPKRFIHWAAFTAAFLDAAREQLHILKEARQGNRVVETVKAYIQRHYTEELELQRLADTVYLTPSYLSKLFKTETGETITDYVISIRIERAKEKLLKEPSLKTYEVGESVGYPDPAYFNKVFKKVAGVTPKEYRERVRL